MKSIKFYSLLFIDLENQSLSINGVTGAFDSQMETFIRCCDALNSSLAFFANLELIVLTNNKSYIENKSRKFKCIEIEFAFKVPKDIKFFAAHYKIDVYKYFSQLSDSDYSFLIDSDVLCINKMPLNLLNCIKKNIPTYYDITEQVYPAYGREIIIKDKEFMMSGNTSIGLWAGGEFIGGDNKFFKLLYNEIISDQEKYLDNYNQFHHIGMEPLVSVALERIMQQIYVCNVGLFGAIGRFWSVKTRHIQNPWGSYVDKFLIHLPADKNFIASGSPIGEDLILRYESYLEEKENLSKHTPNPFIILIKKTIKLIIKK